jgi:hypothetical protein
MVLQGDEDHVKARFGLFGDSASLDARLVHSLCQTYHRIGNHFRCTRWNSSVTWVMWNLISVHLEIVLVSVQDRCMVWVKHSIGSEIIFNAPSGTSR